MNSPNGNASVGRGYEDFMRISKRLHEVSDRFFFWKNVGSLRDTFEAGTTFSPRSSCPTYSACGWAAPWLGWCASACRTSASPK